MSWNVLLSEARNYGKNVFSTLSRVLVKSSIGQMTNIGQVSFEEKHTAEEKTHIAELLSKAVEETEHQLEKVTDSPLMVKARYSDDEVASNVLKKQQKISEKSPVTFTKGNPTLLNNIWVNDQHREHVYTGLRYASGFKYCFGKQYYWDPECMDPKFLEMVSKDILETRKNDDGSRYGYLDSTYNSIVAAEIEWVTSLNNGRYRPIIVTDGTLDQRGRIYWLQNTGAVNINTCKWLRPFVQVPEAAWRRLSPNGEKSLLRFVATTGSRKSFESPEARLQYGKQLLQEALNKSPYECTDSEELWVVLTAQRYQRHQEDSTFQWKWPIELDMTASVITILAIALHDVEALQLIGVLPSSDGTWTDGWTALALLAWSRAKGTQYETLTPCPRAMAKAITTTIYGVGDIVKKLEEDFPTQGNFSLDPDKDWEAQRGCWANQILSLSTIGFLNPLFTWKDGWMKAKKAGIHTVKWLGEEVTIRYTKPVENEPNTQSSLVLERYFGYEYSKRTGQFKVQTPETLEAAVNAIKANNPDTKVTAESLKRLGIVGRKINYNRQPLFWPSFCIHGLDALLASRLCKRFAEESGFLVTNHDAHFAHPNLVPAIERDGHLFLEWVWDKGEETILELAKSLEVEGTIKAYFNKFRAVDKPDFTSMSAFK